MVAPHKIFAPWVTVVSALLLIAAVIAARDFEFTSPGALAFAGASLAVFGSSGLFALAMPGTRRVVLKRASAEANDRENLLATAWVYGAASICFFLLAVTR